LSSGPESIATFLTELGKYAGKPVTVEQCFLKDLSPRQDFLLLVASIHPTLALAECPAQRQVELASRLVPFRVSRKGIFDMLEKLILPAAVEDLAYVEWEASDPDDDTVAGGLYGQREVGQSAGATCVEIFTSARYCYLESRVHHGLPHLLADYLRSWAKVRYLAEH
jgi:hypothetical protein